MARAQKGVIFLQEEKKRIKNLSTYAVILVLSILIVIVFAAMADNRESEFENRINQKEESIASIQDEIVKLKEKNYGLEKKLEEKVAEEEKNAKDLAFYQALNETWKFLAQDKKEDALAKVKEIKVEELSPEQKIQYDAIVIYFPELLNQK